MEISMDKLNKSYQANNENIHVLKNLTCTIKSGEWSTITGPSGSGKTTLLKCLAGIEVVDTGVMRVGELVYKDNTDDVRLEFRKEHIGYIFQDFQLFNQFDVLTNVMIPLIPDNDRKKIEFRAQELLKSVGLSQRVHHMINQLSGGEKQR